MTITVRLDPHAHLYDSYSIREWCRAAFSNLGGKSPRNTPVGTTGAPIFRARTPGAAVVSSADDGANRDIAVVVIVVDREGQDSLARLRREVPSFADWNELWDGQAGRIEFDEGALTVIRGVQYVTSERIEVLGLGVERAAPDAMAASEYVSIITDGGGLACLPWSPGKWLGARGKVVRRMLDGTPSTILTVGDISIRSHLGPPSALLRYARQKGFSVLSGTDPLPRVQDQSLVGSFGLEFSADGDDALACWTGLKNALVAPQSLKPWGRRNSAGTALQRFIASIA